MEAYAETGFGKKHCPRCHSFVGFAHVWGDELTCPTCRIRYTSNALGQLVPLIRGSVTGRTDETVLEADG
jgi:hypothetical protein